MRPALNRAKGIIAESTEAIGVEIGVLRGENAREIMRDWSTCKKLYLVDNYICGFNEHVVAKENLKEWEDRLVWLIENSVESVRHFKDDSLDFVYVDGDHSYEAVGEDMKAYWPKIKPGCVLCGHDYNFKWESTKGVIRAVNEFAEEHNLRLWTETSGSSSDWLVIKQ